MSEFDRTFSSILLKNVKKDLLKQISEKALRGAWTYRYDIGASPSYEVQIPKSETFPKGYYFYCRAYYASQAKAKCYQEICNRIERGDLNRRYPIVIKSKKGAGKWSKN